MPEPTGEISEELKEMIIPHLKEHLDPDSWDYIPQMFEQVVYTQPGVVPLVTLDPIYDYPAMQFSCITGEFMELTNWDYIVALDESEETAEREARELVETIETALRHYHKQEYQVATDYEKVINNREEIEMDGYRLYKYNCPGQTIYLDDTMYPVSYENQLVEGDWYYYNFSDEPVDPELRQYDLYDYKISFEWKRLENIWE